MAYKNKESANAYHRKWSKNPARMEYARKYAREWRKKNAEHFKQYRKQYFIKNKEHIIKMKRGYAVNKELVLQTRKIWNAKNRLKLNEISRQRRINNPEQYRELYRIKSARRRARKFNATLPGFDAEIKKIFKQATEMTLKTGIKYSVDHIWPLKGKRATGLHVPWNLQVIPLSDNIRKRNHEPVLV